MYDTRSYCQVNSLIQSINIQFFVYCISIIYHKLLFFLFVLFFSTMSIEIAENSEINYGKNIGLAWPGQWFLGPATLATCKPACKP